MIAIPTGRERVMVPAIMSVVMMVVMVIAMIMVSMMMLAVMAASMVAAAPMTATSTSLQLRCRESHDDNESRRQPETILHRGTF
jgi:ABC-type bacteriocin/lantibiotic exporter with double-glycine peptidase domain